MASEPSSADQRRGKRARRQPLPIGATTLREHLERLGVIEGDALVVHCSMRRVGDVLGGARGVIEALIGAVGNPGLIMMPAFTRDALMPELPHDVDPADCARIEQEVRGFDPTYSSCHHLGALAETFRSWPGVVRSRHPVHSLTALGPGARDIVAHHPRDWAFGLEGPFGQLLETGRAKVLMLGSGWARCSALHTAETIARHRRLRVLRYKDLTREEPRWMHARDVAEDREGLFDAVGSTLDQHPSMRRGKVGTADSRLIPFDDLLVTAAPIIAAELAAHGRVVERDVPTNLFPNANGRTRGQTQGRGPKRRARR
ncbi:MAG: AAC(3) family N-acetyltransferase [Pseudomonadota bacterium]